MPNDNDVFDIAALEKEEAEDGFAVGIEQASTVPTALVDESPADVTQTTESCAASTDCDTHDCVAEDCESQGNVGTDTSKCPEAPASDADEDGKEGAAAETPKEVVDPCLKCGVEKDPDYPMCRACGYYSTLDTYVDVDEDDPDLILGMENSNGFEMPTWGWVLIGIQFIILLESLFVTINFPNGHIVRTVWSIAQLAIGFSVALSAHARATFLSVMEDADSDIGDFVLKPFKVWGP